jgi:hypothetical protein
MKLPRFQFRLRTLMIGVALLAVACCWAAHQLHIVRERDKMLASDDCEIIIYGDGPRPYGSKGGIPWFRRWLGDREINTIRTFHSTSDDEVERYRVAFPEADVARR